MLLSKLNASVEEKYRAQTVFKRQLEAEPGPGSAGVAGSIPPCPARRDAAALRASAHRCRTEPGRSGVPRTSARLPLGYTGSLQTEKGGSPNIWRVVLTERVWCVSSSAFQGGPCRCAGKCQPGWAVLAEALRGHAATDSPWRLRKRPRESPPRGVHPSAVLKRQHISVSYSSIPVWLFGHQRSGRTLPLASLPLCRSRCRGLSAHPRGLCPLRGATDRQCHPA